MRKLSAFILLFPFGILLFGSMTLSSVCPIAPQEACTQIPGKCCHGEKEKASCPKDQQRNCPRDQKSDQSACCFDCPLCALITVSAFIHFQLSQPEPITEYAVRPDNLLADYYPPHWKPPNIARFSSQCPKHFFT